MDGAAGAVGYGCDYEEWPCAAEAEAYVYGVDGFVEKKNVDRSIPNEVMYGE